MFVCVRVYFQLSVLFRWIADDWSPCHRPCGPGIRTRMVVCAEENNGLKTRVSFECSFFSYSSFLLLRPASLLCSSTRGKKTKLGRRMKNKVKIRHCPEFTKMSSQKMNERTPQHHGKPPGQLCSNTNVFGSFLKGI